MDPLADVLSNIYPELNGSWEVPDSELSKEGLNTTYSYYHWVTERILLWNQENQKVHCRSPFGIHPSNHFRKSQVAAFVSLRGEMISADF